MTNIDWNPFDSPVFREAVSIGSGGLVSTGSLAVFTSGGGLPAKAPGPVAPFLTPTATAPPKTAPKVAAASPKTLWIGLAVLAALVLFLLFWK